MSVVITCAIIMSRTSLPCDLTLVDFGNLDGCFVYSYEFEMDTEKQRQPRCDDVRLTKSGNARSKQVLVVPTQSLIKCNRVWLSGEHLSESEHQRSGWF